MIIKFSIKFGDVRMSFSKKLIVDYVNGNDIDNYDIDELENDYRFMIEVIKYTKDKSMYNLCSLEVKNNYEFVKFMIDFFKDDKRFVSGIVDGYLGKIPKDDIRRCELLVMLDDIISYDDEIDMDLKYSIQRDGFYESKRVEVAFILQSLDNGKSDKDLGFYYILDEYVSSKIITDYFAKRMVKEIFYSNDLKFEEFIHSQFKDCRDIEKIGINNYIVKYVSGLDSDLGDYIHANIGLVSDVKKELERVISNWDNYVDRVSREKIDIFYEEVASIVKKYDNMVGFSYDEAINYVMNKLGLFDFFEKYDSLDNPIYVEMGENYKNYLKKVRYSDNLLDKDNLNLRDLKCLKEIMGMATKLFDSDVIDRSCYDYDDIDSLGNDGKIVKVDFTSRRRKG